MATIHKTVYNPKLIDPRTYIVICGGKKASFDASQKAEVGKWIMSVWETQEGKFFNLYFPAFVYYKWDYESNETLYCKYERID